MNSLLYAKHLWQPFFPQHTQTTTYYIIANFTEKKSKLMQKQIRKKLSEWWFSIRQEKYNDQQYTPFQSTYLTLSNKWPTWLAINFQFTAILRKSSSLTPGNRGLQRIKKKWLHALLNTLCEPNLWWQPSTQIGKLPPIN